jgi:putative hydrolase of the HAD superfamily
MRRPAVIFDYGGVLCLHPRDAQVAELARLCGAPPERFLDAYWKSRRDYDQGDLDPDQYWEIVGRELGRTYSESEVREFRRRDVEFWINLDRRMVGWARSLRASGHPTAVLSNLPRDLGEHMRSRMDLLQEFDHHTFSYEVRAAKPSPAIYHDCLEKLGVRPGDAVFLDDRPENVEAAQAIGIHAVLFESPAQLARALERLAGSPGNELSLSTPPIVLE